MADHLHRVSEVIDNLDSLLSTAFDAHLARISVQQNEDMRKISAGAALVVVPTLIAGVYGMNFDHMPELHWDLRLRLRDRADGRGLGRPAVVLQEVRDGCERGTTVPRLSAWRVVWWFGFVSLAADMVYEGARSVYGPVLAALGASAVVVGLVTGAGEAMALVLRLVFGPVRRPDRALLDADDRRLRRSPRSACRCCALAPRLGAAGLAFAVDDDPAGAPRQGGALASKSALLAHVAAAGRARPRLRGAQGPRPGGRLRRTAAGGRRRGGASLWAGMAVLAVPGAVAMVLLLTLRHRVPDPSVYDDLARAGRPGSDPAAAAAAGGRMPSAPACPATSSATPSPRR